MVEIITKTKDNKLRFKCKSCTLCCRDVTIALYPFDIFNICKRINISTKEFHEKYSILRFDGEILRCFLKMPCSFNEDKLCSIYDSRPLRCRLFPVGRFYEENKTTFILPEKQCIGFESGQKQTIEEWVKANETDSYDKLAENWNRFIIKLKKENKNLQDKRFITIFGKIFYDFDDKLLMQYREKLNIKTQEELMELLYNLADEILVNFDVSEIYHQSI